MELLSWENVFCKYRNLFSQSGFGFNGNLFLTKASNNLLFKKGDKIEINQRDRELIFHGGMKFNYATAQ